MFYTLRSWHLFFFFRKSFQIEFFAIIIIFFLPFRFKSSRHDRNNRRSILSGACWCSKNAVEHYCCDETIILLCTRRKKTKNRLCVKTFFSFSLKKSIRDNTSLVNLLLMHIETCSQRVPFAYN